MTSSSRPSSTIPLPRLSFASQVELLQGIVERCRKGAERRDRDHTRAPVVVFDLDGTLMDNRPRTLAILHEFAKTLAPHARAEAERISALRPDDLTYLLGDSLGQNGITDPAVHEQAFAFWKERFFGDDSMRHDVEVPGAVAFARSCYDAGAVLVYLTGRDLPGMGLGSFRSLRDLGFPIGVPGTELVCKPTFDMPDEQFKDLEAPKLARIGEIVASFDNEPANCNTFLRQNPECASVLLDTQRVPNGAEPMKGVLTIADFRTQG